jgi:hypothetical protein
MAREYAREVVNRLLVARPYVRPDLDTFDLLPLEGALCLCECACTLAAQDDMCVEVRAPVKVREPPSWT